MFLFLLYAVLLVLIFFQYRHKFFDVFKENQKVGWLISGLSLFMLSASGSSSQLYYGIINEKGAWGLYWLWVGYLAIGFVPIVFAPLWQKLDLITDNQFIKIRFSGIGAVILHQFRAFYVGFLVVALVLASQILVFSRILMIFFNWSQPLALQVTFCILCLFSLKNSFALKLRYDVLHALIFFLSLLVTLYFVLSYSPTEEIGFERTLDLNLLPSSSLGLNSLLLYFGLQWLTSQLYDGGGPEMARYTAVKNRMAAVFAGLLPVLISFIITGLLLLLVLKVLSFNPNTAEIGYLEGIKTAIPDGFHILIVLGYFALFISSAEAIMNWGSGMITIDLYKTYFVKEKADRHYQVVSFLVMLVVSILAGLIAFHVDNLGELFSIVLSSGAGVSVVFILRWFWLRINAWSQLSAVVSSAFFTLLFRYYWVEPQKIFAEQLNLYLFDFRFLLVLFCTTATWLIVTFLTPKDTAETLNRFSAILPAREVIIQRVSVALIVGILVFLLLITMVYFILSNYKA
ncbi:MAG: sodium:solute symporter family transporter [Luteibaculaceae bacterium]